MTNTLCLLASVAILCLPAGVAMAQTTACPTGSILSHGICVCQPGKISNLDTHGHCCWPGQVWAVGGGCVNPPRCPAGYTLQAHQCVPNPLCPSGYTRQGQMCVLSSTPCPSGYARQGQGCSPIPPQPKLSPTRQAPPPPTHPDPDDRYDGFEIVATGSFIVNDEAHGLGGSVALGGQWYEGFRNSSNCGGMNKLAAVIFLFGLPCVPGHVWVGNDHGFKVHYHFTSVDSNLTEEPLEQHMVGISVPLMMHFVIDSVRLTVPSLLGFLLPEGGIVLRADESASFYLELGQLPLGLWVSDNFGLVVEPSLLVLPHLQDPEPLAGDPGRPLFFSLDAGATARF